MIWTYDIAHNTCIPATRRLRRVFITAHALRSSTVKDTEKTAGEACFIKRSRLSTPAQHFTLNAHDGGDAAWAVLSRNFFFFFPPPPLNTASVLAGPEEGGRPDTHSGESLLCQLDINRENQ